MSGTVIVVGDAAPRDRFGCLISMGYATAVGIVATWGDALADPDFPPGTVVVARGTGGAGVERIVRTCRALDVQVVVDAGSLDGDVVRRGTASAARRWDGTPAGLDTAFGSARR